METDQKTRIYFYVTAAACAVFGALHVAANMLIQPPTVFLEVLDDALMFVRYADNLIAGKGIAWNPDGEPAYGTTSLTHTMSTAAVRAFARDLLPTYFIQRLGLAYLGLFMLLSGGLLFRLYRGATVGRRLGAAVYWLFVVFSGLLLFHSRSGMDTNLALIHFLLFLYAYYELVERPSRGRVLGAALAGATLFLTRPDLLLFAGLVPLVLWLRDRGNRYFFAAGVVTAGCLGLILLGIRLYFGHFLPLPFYVKGLYWKPELDDNLLNLIWFLKEPMVLLMILITLVGIRRLVREPFALAVLVPVPLYFLYFMFMSNQNMGMGGRFYFPLFVVFFFLAALVLRDAGVPGALRDFMEKRRRWLRPALPAGLALLGLMFLAQVGGEIRKAGKKQIRFKNYQAYFRASSDVYFQLYAPKDPAKIRTSILAELVNMPAGCKVGGSEMGLTGVAFQRYPVYDMLGLNSKRFVFLREKGTVELLMEARPDVLFMPHQNFRELNEKLLKHPVFRRDYIGISPADGLIPMGLALNIKGPCADYFRAALKKTRVPWDTASRTFPNLESLKVKLPGFTIPSRKQ